MREDRQSHDRRSGDDMVSLALRAVQTVGFPVVVAAVLIWLLVERVPNDIGEIKATLAQAVITQTRHTQDTERLFLVMQQICANTAQTPDDRRRCFPPVGGQEP